MKHLSFFPQHELWRRHSAKPAPVWSSEITMYFAIFPPCRRSYETRSQAAERTAIPKSYTGWHSITDGSINKLSRTWKNFIWKLVSSNLCPSSNLFWLPFCNLRNSNRPQLWTLQARSHRYPNSNEYWYTSKCAATKWNKSKCNRSCICHILELRGV